MFSIAKLKLSLILNIVHVNWGIPKQPKYQTAEYFFLLQSDWLKFEIELNSLS